MRITKLQREPEGFLTARVTLEGQKTWPVHRKFGSWMRDYPGRPGWMLELPREVVEVLAKKAATFEKRERNGEPQEADEAEAVAA